MDAQEWYQFYHRVALENLSSCCVGLNSQRSTAQLLSNVIHFYYQHVIQVSGVIELLTAPVRFHLPVG